MTKRTGKKTKNAPEFIHQFIKKRAQGQKQVVGVLVCRMDEAKQMHYGWSKVNISAGDKFDRELGVSIALERTKARKCLPIPHSLHDDAKGFAKRCERYFQDAIYTGELKFQDIHQQMDDLLAD